MKKVEAMEWAADFAVRTKLFEPVTNGRGYADGWKPPTPAEKARVIRELAEQVAEDDEDTIRKSEAQSMVLSLLEQNRHEQWDADLMCIHPNFVKEIRERLRG